MTNIKECIIVGGGPSIEPYRDILPSILKNKFVILCNYAYKHFPGTILTFTDRDFYFPNQDCLEKKCHPYIYEELKKLPLIIGINHNGIEEFKLDNTILLDKKYREHLTGIFALKLAEMLIESGNIYLCYSEDTEVFTNQGWKYFKDLDKSELILTRKANGETEWSPILNYYKYNYDGIMKHIKSKGIDLLVTPDHSQCLLSKSNKEYIFKPINKLTNSNYKIPKIFNWRCTRKNYFILPGYTIKYKQLNHYRTKTVPNIKIKMNDWLAFLGLYISEGCCLLRKDRSNCELIIYQNHNKKSDKLIESILKKLPFNYSYHKRGWVIYDKRLINYLKKLGKCKNKYIPTELKNLPKEQLLILINSLMFGDGHTDKKRSTNYYFTVSKQLADDIQEIAYKCGNNAEIYDRRGRKCKISTKPNHIGLKSYTVYFNKNNKQGNVNNIVSGNLVFNHKIKNINYSGKIYDITVNNHTLWVRRNGVCVWSGNCGFDWTRRQGLPERDPNYNPNDNKLTLHYYKKEIIHRGNNFFGYYENHNPDNDFKPYINKKDIKIFNVSPNSNIECFEKINYEKFLQHLTSEVINQGILRVYIKNKLIRL